MSKEIFVISDTHFGHANILNFVNDKGEKIRSFHDVYEMDEIMIKNWNAVVSEQDKVYHLGDVYFGSQERANQILSRLKGKKRLILGNHDNGKDSVLQKHFQKVGLWRTFKEEGLLLTHVPVHPSTLKEGRFGEYKMINVHGHIHANPSPDGPYKCVCVEQINYTPVNIEILKQ